MKKNNSSLREAPAAHGRALRPDQDRRYDYCRCKSCGEEFQNIDFGSAAHRLMCPNPQRGAERRAFSGLIGEHEAPGLTATEERRLRQLENARHSLTKQERKRLAALLAKRKRP